MKTTSYSLALQSRKTGRFLLEELNGVWNFAVTLPYDDNYGMLYELLARARVLMDLPMDWDDFSIDYVDEFPNGAIFHALVDDEALAPGSKAQWFSLFEFPENFDPKSDALFDNRAFVERIVAPYH